MIIGIGIDSISTTRIKKLVGCFEQKFEKKVFSAQEISKANSIKNSDKKILFFAKRFAAKEAFAKAIGLGIGRGVNFCDIEVENDSLGKPSIKILNEKTEFLLHHFSAKKLAIHLSLTDEKTLASAFVIIEKIS
jgi:holo-[acyl-carrier protein] synthase